MDHVLPRTRVGAYVLCVRESSLLLVRYSGTHRWTLPGGGIDHGERPEDAAVREVAEETGLQVELRTLLAVDSAIWRQSHDGRPINVHSLRIVYAGDVVGGELRDEVDGSTDRAEWVPVADVVGRDRSRIVDLAMESA